ncbi:MAG TPA: bifunctional helix-turn-helix domain-containing protein/methylated-DNA--[protein]-cysteine S-methyltransferase [Aestuariivirga sp.]|nr:bifunctional helix-turn-helix domain-containing protein/methylated-DNA--[protein]-cysteine S-methyltransferase [Aestuariivirga sp.]
MTETSDYQAVKTVLSFLSDNWRDQPSLDELAEEAGLSPHQLHRLFTRWAGISPKDFLQALTLDHARALLRQQESVLDTALAVGLSGPSRLHDLFVTHEGITPGIYKAKGEGLVVRHGFHASPFGRALVMVAEGRLCGLAFADEGDEARVLADMTGRWPRARFRRDEPATAPLARRIFTAPEWRADQPLRIVMIGSDFEIKVWERLLAIPMGAAASYGGLARALGSPGAARAVGAAVGKNPLSFVVPCHRVLGSGGALTGYHWGLARKRAMLGWEAGRLAG